jgi:RsiW-degrading membrane proteinase PrsW (M82 family)
MLSYILPVVAFFVVSLVMYFLSSLDEKNEPKNIMFRNILPGIVIAMLTYIILKHKDLLNLNKEPLMSGNYFD